MPPSNPNLKSKTFHTILIAVDGAPKGSGMSELKYCVSDAKELAIIIKDILPEERDYKDPVLLENRCLLSLRKEINKIISGIKPKDTILVWVNGHGVVLKEKLHFCCWDTVFVEPDNYQNTYPMDELVGHLIESEAKEIILYVDTCHSGGMTFPDIKPKNDQKFYALLSCESKEFSYQEEALKSSLFTYYLMEALKGGAETNSQGELITYYVEKYVCEELFRHQKKLDGEMEVMNQSLMSQGYPRQIVKKQTPLSKSSNGNNIVLSRRPTREISFPPRLALLVHPEAENLSNVLSEKAFFEVEMWNNQRPILENLEQKLDPYPRKPTKTVLIYLQGQANEQRLTCSGGETIKLNELKEVLKKGNKVKQILVLDLIGTPLEIVNHWVNQLGDAERIVAQGIIGISSRENDSHSCVNNICEIINQQHQQGLSFADLIKRLQDLELFKNKIAPWLSGNRGIIEIIPETSSLNEYYQTSACWLGKSKNSFDNLLSSNILTNNDGAKRYAIQDFYVDLSLIERKKRRRIGEIYKAVDGSQIHYPFSSMGGVELGSEDLEEKFEGDEFFQEVLGSEGNRNKGKSQGKRIAIVGEPGAGKTTLLQKVFLWICDCKGDIPIWVSAKSISKEQSLRDYLIYTWLPDALRTRQVTEEIVEAFKKQFTDGRVWLLLDGIDEITWTDPLNFVKDNISGWLEDTRVIFSVRLNTWEIGGNPLSEYDAYRTIPFSDLQREKFISNWFKSEPDLAASLLLELSKPENQSIQDTVTNPLCLMMLCHVWMRTEGRFPASKAELYQEFTENSYILKNHSLLDEDRENLHLALGRLALWALSRQDVGFRLNLKILDDEIKSLLNRKIKDRSLKQWAIDLGWLNEVGVRAEYTLEKVYAFFHPTFQEYFAATSIKDGKYFIENNRLLSERYQQVLLFWIGRRDLDPSIKQKFLHKLINCEGEHLTDEALSIYSITPKELNISYLVEAYSVAASCIGVLQAIKGVDDKKYQFLSEYEEKLIFRFSKWLKNEKLANEIRIKAAKGLADLKCAEAMQVLLNEFKVGDQDEHDIIYSTFLQVDDPAIVNTLISIVKNKEEKSYLRESAAKVLGYLKKSEAVSDLIDSLYDSHGGVASNVAQALGNIGGEEAYKALIEALNKTEVTTNVRQAAAISLGKLGYEQAVPILINFLERGEEIIRQAAATSLGYFKDFESLNALKRACKDRERNVERAAKSALNRRQQN